MHEDGGKVTSVRSLKSPSPMEAEDDTNGYPRRGQDRGQRAPRLCE